MVYRSRAEKRLEAAKLRGIADEINKASKLMDDPLENLYGGRDPVYPTLRKAQAKLDKLTKELRTRAERL